MGKKAPLSKNIGIIKKFMIKLNPSKDSMRDAINNPREVKAKEARNIRSSTSITIKTVRRTPTKGESASMIPPWIMDWKHPDSVFPTATDVLDTGATRISRKKPNCRSQIMETAEKTLVKRTVMPMIPGNKNWE